MDVSNAKNPFLFDDPGPPEPQDVASNPFLSGGPFDYASNAYSGINPFSDQIDESTANAMNIFGDQPAFTSEINPFSDIHTTSNEINSGNVRPFDIFGSAIPAEPALPDNLFGIEQAPKPPPPRPPSPAKNFRPESPSNFIDSGNIPGRPPPPRPPPPSKETKDLLQTVIGAIEATTDTLQDKLNTTRTPCPSPGSGAHGSRSPTPDIQITAPDKGPDAFSAIFGQTIELSDQEIDENQTQQNQSGKEPAPTSNEEIDLFGDTITQSKPKTTQDILSLFNKPKDGEQQQFDLLSGDLISDSTNEDDQASNKKDTCVEPVNGSGLETQGDLQLESEEPKLEASPFEVDGSAISEPATNLDQAAESEKVDGQPAETSSSPELVSEKSDTEEPTVIEANISKNLPNEVTPNVDSATEENKDIELDKQVSIEDPFSEPPPPPASIFDSPFDDKSELPPPEANELPPESESPEDFPPPPPPLSESSDIGLPPSAPEESFKENVSEVQPATIFGSEPLPPAFDSPAESIPEPKPEAQPDVVAGLFGDIPPPPSTQSVPNAFDIFGAPSSTPFGPPPVPKRTPVATFEPIQAAATTGAALFEPSPALETTGAALFESVPQETTGAALFESTPAPNVGMSLFGGGQEAALDIFAESESNTMVNPFAPSSPMAPPSPGIRGVSSAQPQPKLATDEEFDAFSARFDSAVVAPGEHEDNSFDPFGANTNRAASPWGGEAKTEGESLGFGDNAQFDSFLSMNEPPPVPQSTPRRIPKQSSGDSDEGPMSVVIKPASQIDMTSASPRGISPVPILAPPPAATLAFADSTPRFNPFDKGMEDASEAVPRDFAAVPKEIPDFKRSESLETPPTPLFEEDQSVPLEPFLRTNYDERSWEMFLRQPNKKKITGQRFWKKIYVRFTSAGALQLYNNQDDKEPFQELPLQPCYSVSDIGAQQFDQFGKIFTVKLQYIFYKERPGVRPGQISKAERITTKLSKFAQYAIAGDYEGVKEFASDVRKLGMPVEHAPQISQLMKLGTQNYEDLKLFASLVEEFMFKLTSSRDRALTYKTEEVQLTAVDELYVDQDLNGAVTRMLARVRIFFLGFLSGMPEVDLGINDLKKQGHEVVGRHDIIPIVTEEWIRLEDIEFHNTVDTEEFDKTRHIKFKPPDGCYIELIRFRVRPPKNRELPLRVKTKMTIQGRKIDINCEILVPGFSGRKLGQVPCEDVAVRFPLPECWIYMFRVEKHFRYGSVKSAHRRTGKVKGMERIKGAVETSEAALMEVTSGQAKYEHQHRAIVWRVARLPKEGQGAYSVHQFTCKMHLTDFDQMPESLDKHCVVEFTMPATTVSHCVMRSVSVTSDEPPEKYVRYLARHEYKIEIEFSSGTGPNEYIAATMKQQAQEERRPQPVQEESSSDESS